MCLMLKRERVKLEFKLIDVSVRIGQMGEEFVLLVALWNK